MTLTYLYELFDIAGDLLYVGITADVETRMGQHARNQPWWGEVEDRRISSYPTRDAAAAAEERVIRVDRPAYNVTHSDPARTRRMLSSATGQPPADRLRRQRGHQPPPGMSKATINLRTAIWDDVKRAAAAGGVHPVAVIEAMLVHYLADTALAKQVNYDALHVTRERRQVSFAASLAEADADLSAGRTRAMGVPGA